MIFSDNDDIEELEVNRFELITKSDTLDFDEGVNLCLLREMLDNSCPPCVRREKE